MTHRQLAIPIKRSEKYINTIPHEFDIISHFDMSSSTIKFIPGRKKGSHNVLYYCQLYHLNRKKNERTCWKCNKCRSRLTLVLDTFLTDTPHLHDPQPADVAVHRSKTTLKNLASHRLEDSHHLDQKTLQESSEVGEV